MKRIAMSLSAVLLGGFLGPSAAQSFSSGSDGSMGALTLTGNTTLDIPPDGIFHFTTVTVPENLTLTFKKNPLNTPVYILATGDVTINGIINVSGSGSNPNIPDGGAGGPGGFDGGKPGFGAVPPGNGQGPGGGKGGVPTVSDAASAGGGGFGSRAEDWVNTYDGEIYGNPLLIALIGGSGGGGTTGQPGRGGGGGGGAILIASSTKIELSSKGKIYAQGGNNSNLNEGSGGAIRLVAPVVSGTGELNVECPYGNYAGDGRIRVDSINRSGLAVAFRPLSATTVGSTMLVFPEPLPRLDITEACGRAISVGEPAPVIVNLPFNSPTGQVVRLRAKDFNSVVPVRVVLTPDNGQRVVYDAEIDNKAANPATVDVPVVMPVNVQVTINAWTR